MNFAYYYFARGQYRQAEMYRKMTAGPRPAGRLYESGLSLKPWGRYQEAEQSLLKELSLRSSWRCNSTWARYIRAGAILRRPPLFQDGSKSGAPSAALHRNLGDAYRHLSRGEAAGGIARGLTERCYYNPFDAGRGRGWPHFRRDWATSTGHLTVIAGAGRWPEATP
jgi:hypothetical protein